MSTSSSEPLFAGVAQRKPPQNWTVTWTWSSKRITFTYAMSVKCQSGAGGAAVPKCGGGSTSRAPYSNLQHSEGDLQWLFLLNHRR